MTIVTVLVVICLGCVQRLHRAVVAPESMATVDRGAPYLKIHMRDGTLYVLSPWEADEAGRRVSGTGTHYGLDRTVLRQGALSVSLDSVALFETNVSRPSPSVAALAVISGITAGIAIYCATNTKACFGSCPTFYVTDGAQDILQAEGFSSSVAPGLEARDVDALYRARPEGGKLLVEMVNEAYETHVIRHVNVLALPRPEGQMGERVLRDDAGVFWSVTEPQPARECGAPEGDCAGQLSKFDQVERTSAADSADLAARETIDLVFDSVADSPALVIGSRQSLMHTYLLYQAFAYLGTTVGDFLAAFERSGAAATRTGSLVTALGGIDVLVANAAGGWDSVSTVQETGPLASDVRVVPLPAGSGPVRVRLRMAKGAWRVDLAALVELRSRVEPVRIEPSVVRVDGHDDTEARAKLLSVDDVLVTFPGDRYTLEFDLPGAGDNYELFLESQGYYLEWMRREWLDEEDQARAAALFLDPAGALRRLAPAFKRAEPELEAAFWRSKYVGS